jgi:hypothetical protein
MTNTNSEVDVNLLIKIYNQRLSTLTNQNVLLEAKLQTLTQDFLEEKNNLLQENLELQEKYEGLLKTTQSKED